MENSSSDRRLSGRAKLISREEMQLKSEYALKIIEKACGDILKLDVTPKPLVVGGVDPCKSCKFFGLCRFSEHFGNVKRKPDCKIDKSYFEFLSQEGQDGQI